MANIPLADVCVSPPACDDTVLIAALDGETSTDILTHLRVCAVCAARALQQALVRRRLHEQLHRVQCPPSEQLADFQQGILDDLEHLRVAQHIAACSHCTRELWLLNDVLATPLIVTTRITSA